MQSNFRAEKLKRAKWIVTKGLEMAQEKQQEMEFKVEKKRSWLQSLKLKIFGL